MSANVSYREILLDHFRRRKSRNSSYSLRAYARDIGLTPSHLSSILLEQYGLSEKKAFDVASKLKLNKYERDYFLDLVNRDHARSPAVRLHASKRLQARAQKPKSIPLSENELNFYDSWFYAAVWQKLAAHQEAALSPKEIAVDLGIDIKDVQQALKFLEANARVSREAGRFKIQKAHFFTSSPIPAKSIRAFHKQILNLASQRLEQLNQSERKNLSVILSVDAERIEEARAFLQETYDEFMRRFQDQNSVNSVCALTLAFFRIDGRTRA